MSQRIAGQAKRKSMFPMGDDQWFAWASLGFVDPNRIAEALQQSAGEVVVAYARSAGNKKQVREETPSNVRHARGCRDPPPRSGVSAERRCLGSKVLRGLCQSQFLNQGLRLGFILRQMKLFRRDLPLSQKSADERGVAVADLSWTWGLVRRNQFIARGQMQHPRKPADERLGMSETSQQAQRSVMKLGPNLEQHLALAGLFTTKSNVLFGSPVQDREAGSRDLGVFLHHDLQTLAGQCAACGNADRLPELKRPRFPFAGANLSYDAELRTSIIQADGVAVHGRAIERRLILRGMDRLAQDPAQSVMESDTLRRQRWATCADQGQDLFNLGRCHGMVGRTHGCGG